MPRTMAHTDTTRAEVEAVTQAWATHFNNRQAASLAMLYHPNAVLWGTLSPDIISTPEGVRLYFDAVCTSPIALRVSFEDELIRSCGDAMLNSGKYTFTFVEDGSQHSFLARFSMTIRKQDGKWLIADHHSSARPHPRTAPVQ